MINVEWHGKRSTCPGLRGIWRPGVRGTWLGQIFHWHSERDLRPNFVANKQRSCSKCKNTLGKIIDHIVNDNEQLYHIGERE